MQPFNRDVTKYFEFKHKFKRHIELLYSGCDDRMSFLESVCVGKAEDVIVGLSCLIDCADAYKKAWSRLK